MVDILLLVSLAIITYIDIKYNKICNVIAYSVILIGLVLNYLFFDCIGLLSSLCGFILAIIIGIISLKLNLCRYGEFKMLAIIGIFKGWHFLILVTIIIYSFFILNLILVLLTKGSFLDTLKSVNGYVKLAFQYGISLNTIIDYMFKCPRVPFSLVISLAIVLVTMLTYF